MQINTSTHLQERNVTQYLSEFWLPHLIATEDLFTHLEYVDTSCKELRSEALRQELETFDDMLVSELPSTWRFKEYRRRTIITLVGEITYLRRIYIEPSGICHALLDEVLGIRTRFKLAPDAFLWIAKTAADISYRKTAKAFFERTGAKISHWLVMAVVHEEGNLILEELYEKAFEGKRSSNELLISSERLFVEFDGIHIPLQKKFHEPKKTRRVYEKNRKKNSFELKVGCFYAGKNKRRRRVGCIHFATDTPAAYYWPLLNAKIASVYDTEYISEVHSSADAAGWCKNSELDVFATATKAVHHLDRFHLNREIRRAFGGNTDKASHFISLAYKKRTKKMFRDLQKVINHVKDKSKYLDLQAYLLSNKDLIKQGAGPSMGTMEGTNAHVYAARMKVWGGAWSRKGAEAMAALRARLASREELIVPKPDNVLYDDFQIKKRKDYEHSLRQFNCFITQTQGKGYEAPQGSVALTSLWPRKLQGILGRYLQNW